MTAITVRHVRMHVRAHSWLALGLMFAAPALARGQAALPAGPSTEAGSPVVAASHEEASACGCVPAGTPVTIEITEAISSANRRSGEPFALRLAEAIAVAGGEVVPAGTAGMGEIVHAARSRGGGKPGELLLAARHLDHAGRQLKLRALKFGAAGRDRTGVALATSFVVGPFAMFVRGQEIEIPPGTRAQAKLAEALPIVTLSLTASPPTPIPEE